MSSVYPKFYCVYLLNSISKKNSYYIGSTPDPYRRLRQHNGILSVGGAYKTKKKGYRPWNCIMLVYGFPSKISALQFEHAWQHSYQTRHINDVDRLSKSKSSGTGIHYKIGNLKLLLNSNSFKRLGLKVCVFDNGIYNIWMNNKFKINVPDTIIINTNFNLTQSVSDEVEGNHLQLRDFVNDLHSKEDEYFERSLSVLCGDSIKAKCTICNEPIERNQMASSCYFKDCNTSYHLNCWGDHIVTSMEKDDDGDGLAHLIPITGKCTRCNRINWWNNIVKNSYNVLNKMNS
ncbi:hypothetical protein CANARDRAFT_224448 [[Candida] arabinofermentans NRRL YB-2248]|uniref:GIY-YIG domain-containing protein n=1 Tax=[Candida] arabinofermentans NRRL YB-2248 TaxID=983967 RepID=A0A1E4SWY9_9ASCO|nr:hypothetical protein CANARDRAFT_224448 [[Candida] arabinofermentans NRRL YB-2248]